MSLLFSVSSVLSVAIVIDHCPCFRRDDNIIDIIVFLPKPRQSALIRGFNLVSICVNSWLYFSAQSVKSAVLFPFTFALFLPGSQDFAAGGEIELAYHRIQQPAAELNWSQQPLQCYGARASYLSYCAACAGFSLAKDLADVIIAASEKLEKLFGGDSPNGVQSEDSSEL